MNTKNIKRFIILSLIVFVTAAVTVCKAGTDTKKIEAAVSNLEREDGTKWTVDEAMSQLGLKGLSAVVIENYQIAWTRTWGVKEAGSREPIDKETAFSTASIAKPITAALLAILAEKGLIDLDLPVANYLLMNLPGR
jgi:CubicO group peptidase (beta-lactamase class C family)